MIINMLHLNIQVSDKRKYIKFYPGASLSIEFENNSKIEIKSKQNIKIFGDIKQLAYQIVSHIIKNNYTITSGNIINNIFNINGSVNYTNLMETIMDMFFPFNPKTQKFKLSRIKSTPETKQLIKEMNRIYPTVSLLI